MESRIRKHGTMAKGRTNKRHGYRRMGGDHAEGAAFEAVRLRSAGIEEEMLSKEGGSADDAEFASAAGCNLPDLLRRVDAHGYFYVDYEGRRYWPRWQLGLPGLHEVLSILAKKGAVGFSIVTFFLTPTDVLWMDSEAGGGVRKKESPYSLLRRRGDASLPLVVRHADRWGEHGAT